MTDHHPVGVSPLTMLGPRIRQARAARGMTCDQLEKALDWRPGYVTQLEHGCLSHCRWLSIGNVVELAGVLHCQVGFLLGEHAYLGKMEDTTS